MAEFKLGRIKFVWKGDWVSATEYYKDDIAAYGGKSYVCVSGHTAASDFYTDSAKWNQFADGIAWKGDWASIILYKINDIVKYGGFTYICITGHTSQSTLELDQAKWEVIGESFDWQGDWTTLEDYRVNDLVRYGGRIYICNTAHTSSGSADLGLEQDQAKWDVFSTGLDWKGAWSTGIRYKVGDLVKYGGTTYVCNTAHTSAATATLGLEADQAKWDYFNQGIEYKGAWNGGSIRYKINDVVKYGAGAYICTTQHTSTASFITDQGNWTVFVEGIEYENTWTNATVYQPGDIVKYGGYSYISKTNHVASNSTPPSTNTTDYALFTQGFSLSGDYNNATSYKVGEVIRLNGFTYVATADTTGNQPPNVSYWSLLNEGIKWQDDWTTSTNYVLGDAIRFGNSSYICVLAHASDAGNRPDNDLSGTYWNALSTGNEETKLTTLGDLVYYGGAGAARLPIGDEGQVLQVSNGIPTWSYFGRVGKVYYVSPEGTDSPAPTYGLTVDQAWRTVRYACEQVEKGTEFSQAAYLLDQNRTFIQKEIVEWVDYQIANTISPFGGAFTYNKEKCQRDMGLLIDAVIYDLRHTGNVKSRAVAQSYFTPLGASYITGQETETVAAINYGASLIANVLSNTAPAQNYQTLNGIGAGSRIKQIIDAGYVSESGASTTVSGLIEIVTDAITAGDLDDLPSQDKPNFTINLKTGLFEEVLPIILSTDTALVGDELRSTRVSPAGKIIATNDKAKSVDALTHLKSITDDIVTNNAIAVSSGNLLTQDTTSQLAGNTGSATAISRVVANAAEIRDILTNGEESADAFSFSTPTGFGTSLTDTAYASTGNVSGATTGYDNAVAQIVANRAFIVDEITEWIAAQVAGPISPFTADFTYDSAACERDVGLILDALRYDLTYGGNTQTRIAADAYFSYGVSTLGEGETEETLAAYAHLKDVVGYVIDENTGWSKNTSLTQDTSGTAGSTASKNFAQARIQEIYDTIDNEGTLPSLVAPATSWVSTELVTSRTLLNAKNSQIQTDSVQFIKTRYPTLNFNEATCSRDVGYIVDALGYDLMFNTNFASIKAGLAYRRGISSAQLVVSNQLSATQDIIDFISKQASYIVSAGSVQIADLIWTDLISYVDTGARPTVIGTNDPVENLNQINGAKILLLNKDFIAAEATAYINSTYTTAVSASSSVNNRFTVSDTSWMVVGDQVRFTGTVFGGVALNTTYYVKTVHSGTEFDIADTLGGSVKVLTTASGSMTCTYFYDTARCQNDVRNYVDAIAYDMIHSGNYKSVLAARYYRSAFTGSKLEDMYYVRNGGGIRNQTLLGLDGTSDGNTTGQQNALTATNEYNTRRPNAGAYVSLDPGWGPNDQRVWITDKSTYVQNVTTFGTGATGQKIDGFLHNGGNDSIVSNDFTQVISDGIGAWVTNLGRAELVSVFSYYAHIGYLAENGGKIRATNGNNSYGDYGSVAEGVDISETVTTGQIDNRSTEADIANVFVDGNTVLLLEYGNAGSEYTSANYTISGSGSGASARADEFRDEAVFQVRLTDPGDSSGPGGVGYITASNQGQAGTSTQITLAAADVAASTAYVGMRIDLVSGTGAGQFGIIDTYNSGTKIATVIRPSRLPDTVAGWDHLVPGTPIAGSLGVTTTYEITPAINISAPPYNQTRTSMPSRQNWSDVVYGNARATYTNVSASGGAGNLATFDVIRHQGTYTVTVNVSGSLYVVGDVLTITGNNLGGTTPANDLTITVESITLPAGNIAGVSWSGTAIPGLYVAISTSTAAATSLDGITWTAMTMPTTNTSPEDESQWVAIDYGILNNIGTYVAVARASSQAAYSTNGTDWTLASLNEVTDWCDVSYGNGTFVAIAESDSSQTFRAVTTNGSSWSTSTLASGAKAIAYGKNRWVIVEGSYSNAAAYSTNGTSWSTSTLPANDDSAESNWVDIAFGNNRWVAVTDSNGMAAYSFDGVTWYKSNLPVEADWTSIRYGQGVFWVSSDRELAASSPDGVTWTLRDATYAQFDILTTAKDTNTGYTARTLPNSGYWRDVIWTGTKFIAVGSDNSSAPYGASSADGESWSSVTLPTILGNFDYIAVAYNGSDTYAAVIYSTRHVATSSDGVSWTGSSNAIPTAGGWSDMVWGSDKFVIVSSEQNRTAYSTDGITWSNGNINAVFTEARAIVYGGGKFVAVHGATAASQLVAHSSNGISWTVNTGAPAMPASDYWSSVAYGDDVFVAVAGDNIAHSTTSSNAAYSTDGGVTWSSATLPGAAAAWTKVVYGGGAFTAIAYNSNRTAYSADGGVNWIEGPALTSTANWNAAAYGNDRVVALQTGGSTGAASNNFVLDTNLLTTQSTANMAVGDRIMFVDDSAGAEIFGDVNPLIEYYVKSIPNATQFSISESRGGSTAVLSIGSGSMLSFTTKYITASALGNYQGTPRWIAIANDSQGAINIRQGAKAIARALVINNELNQIKIHEPGSGYSSTPSITITDPNNTGADATTLIRIGNGALAQPTFISRGSGYAAAAAELIGDGFADNYQVGAFVGFKNLSAIPKSGSNIQIAGIDDVFYRLVNVTNLSQNADETYNATLQLSPEIGTLEAPEHETAATMRRFYSQVRLTGHDFLDIGTGNFVNTNYPGLPLTDPIPANEAVLSGGGRVFWTSTDQDGNFRVGGLFNVEQSTGIATLNADAFNIAGLNELSLGSVALGGSGATITEFSTDPFFTLDSDNVVPTQRAIKAYITSQIGGGGSSLNVNTLTAGVVFIAGQTITTTTNVQIDINTKVNFKSGVDGYAIATNFFLQA